MKVLFLARYLPQEGSTTHMYTLAKALINRGHNVHLISSGPGNDDSAINIFNEIKQEGLTHHYVGFPNNPKFNFVGKIVQLVKYLFAAPHALIMIYRIKPDVIHVHYPVTSYVAKLYKIFTGKKFIVTHHISGIPKHPLHKKADYAVAISQELKKELIEQFKYNEDQVALICNGVSRDVFDVNIDKEKKLKLKNELKLPHDKPIIGFVGSLIHRKGLDVLLSACSLIERDFHIVLLGDGDIEWVNSLIEENDLEGKVSVFPFQNPLNFYSVLDLFVLPSRKEGFALVSIEAMMVGMPILRSNVEGASDQIIDGYNGYIFNSEDSKQLAGLINHLLANDNFRVEMGTNAKLHATSNFTDEHMINKLISLYKKTVDNKS